MTTTAPTLRPVLGDQLALSLASLRGADRTRDVVVMVEVADEATYAPHHPKKIAFILAAMRAFAKELRENGWRVDYVRLDDRENTGSFDGEILRAMARHTPEAVVLTEASEWRVLEMQRRWVDTLDVPVRLLEDDRFVCSRAEFAAWADGRKQMRMEHFYRLMRRRTGLLMEEDQPAGGQWNYDADNRKPAARDLFMPRPPRFVPDVETQAVLDLVDARFSHHFGDLRPFWFAVTRQQAQAARDHFMTACLSRFGEVQDAMLAGEPFLFHAVLSLYLNVGLLDPLDLCRRAEAEWRAGRAPLNSVEGFIRQIIGWREFVRGVYWQSMPGYTALNHFGATRPLPALYWTGQTRMACMADTIAQTRREAYAHHIQRLMVTGNFALIAGIDPFQVHEWYLAVYADAFEWVEAPNTIGMSQFADGGALASKPYAASGAYINRMSDHCKGCAYAVTQKTGPGACPFNPLYWDFMDRNRASLARNPRLGPVYRTWDTLGQTRQAEIRADAARVLDLLAKGQL